MKSRDMDSLDTANWRSLCSEATTEWNSQDKADYKGLDKTKET